MSKPRHLKALAALARLAVVIPPLLAAALPSRAQAPEDFAHFWFLVNLANCGGEVCVVASPVFQHTAVRPDSTLVERFQARTVHRFHGVDPQPMVEPVGSRWRDEVEAWRARRLEAWRRLGWTVYVIEVADQPTPERLLPARADAEVAALAAGYRAELRGEMGLAALWYRRALDVSAVSVAARDALERVESRLRDRAASEPSSPGA